MNEPASVGCAKITYTGTCGCDASTCHVSATRTPRQRNSSATSALLGALSAPRPRRERPPQWSSPSGVHATQKNQIPRVLHIGAGRPVVG
eukprot:1081170-Prorocentrum_minimum.AAC.1